MTMQSIFRNKYTRDYTVLGNKTLEDSQLTFEARGLLCFLLAKPPNWTVVMNHIINSSPAGKHKVRRIVDELLKYGYLVRFKHRTPEGRFLYTAYEVYGEPQSDYREVDKREVENPLVDKQPLVSKHLTKKTNNKETTTKNENLLNELCWPEKIIQKQKISILKISENEDVVVVQKILDLISGSKKEVRNVVGLYHHYLKLHTEGELDFSNSITQQTKREKKELGEKRYKEQMRLSEQKILNYLDNKDLDL